MLGVCKEPACKEGNYSPGLIGVLDCRHRETEAQGGAEMARVLQWLVAGPGCPMGSMSVKGRLSPGPGRAPRSPAPAPLCAQCWG